MRRLTALNELWKGRGVSAEKRKRKILEKQDEFERESAEVSNVSKGGQESVEDIGDDDNDDFYDADDGIVGKKGE